MKVNLDENGYVIDWALAGDNGGIDVPEPDDLEEFIFCATGYKVVDGLLQKDDTRDRAQRIEKQKEALRQQRETECFPVINRGWMWYSSLNLLQWIELKKWYLEWLNVTETLCAPERPSWMDNIDTSAIPDRPIWL